MEGLGSVSVICSDKTGTLTQNKMTVEKALYRRQDHPAGRGGLPDPIQEPLLRTALLCSDATINENGEVGDPTETALVRLGEAYGVDEEVTRGKYPRLTEMPFDSDRKLMSTVHQLSGGLIMVTKGAVDVLLDRCIISDGGAGGDRAGQRGVVQRGPAGAGLRLPDGGGAAVIPGG